MKKLAVLTWIGNAAAVLCGRWGAVTAQTQAAACSRQAAYEQAERVEQLVTEAQQPGPSRAQLLVTVAQLQSDNQQLWQALEHAVDLPVAKQQRFAATAAALGSSLGQTRRLLELLLGPRCPSRAKLGRWVVAAARRAGKVLQKLDAACVVLVCTACLDEIYCHRRPIFVAVEPCSMTWIVGQRVAHCDGDTWQQTLQPWTFLAWVVCDAGTALQAGLEKVQQKRPTTPDGQTLGSGLDLFHTKQEAHQVLRVVWAPVAQAWQRAEKASAVLANKRWHGDKLPAQRAAHAANRAWRKARQRMETYEVHEQAWRRIERALEWFRPDGALNDRAWAEAEIAQALTALPGPLWAKLRRFLQDPRSLAFLDRLHEGLVAAEPRSDLRAALVQLWRLRHPGRRAGRTKANGVLGELQPVLQAVVCQGLATDWRRAYRRVANVLGRHVRASSVVECMNSVVRMHQARHRSLSQELLDLKRLHWNCRRFHEGKRRACCPYEHLGLRLPTYDWWELLNTDPAALAQQLSPSQLAA
jgi:hypothetical protein